MKRNQMHFRGCLIGGAIGDALGWPVEFMSLAAIKQKYGEGGITELVVGKGGKAEITDDTQMAIFTAEGLLRAQVRQATKGICHWPSIVYSAYQRWLYTQDAASVLKGGKMLDGWIIRAKELHVRRAPGNTCISALQSGRMGTIEAPINNSKGCGGVVRVAPVGLFFSDSPEAAFDFACECAALTHGHPSGYLSAGVLAYLIAAIISGAEIEDAVARALDVLKRYEDNEECHGIISRAVELAQSSTSPDKAVTILGKGGVGEEAIAISVYCALKYRDNFRKAICLAVNHNGDSDSTGAITGNILGAYLGFEGIPTEWVQRVELTDMVTQLADDLLTGLKSTKEWWDKYPGW